MWIAAIMAVGAMTQAECRAGLDYHEYAEVRRHHGFLAFRDAVAGRRLLAFSTRGRQPYHRVDYDAQDVLLFGPETRGLPDSVLSELPADRVLRLPMRPGVRSLNLSNAVAIVAFEAWRQLGFPGGH